MYSSGIDLNQAAVICGYDELILIDAGDINESDQINYAALATISSTMGNALTKAIASTAHQPWVIGDDPWDTGGSGAGQQGWTGMSNAGGPGGAISEI